MFYEVLHEYRWKSLWAFLLWLVILFFVIYHFHTGAVPRLTVPGGIAMLIVMPPWWLIKLWRIARDREKEIDAARDIEEKKNK